MLKRYEVTAENYRDEVHFLKVVAAAQPTPLEGKSFLKEAAQITKFFESSLEDLETPATKRIGLEIKDRVIFRYYDRSKSEKSRDRRWTEFLLIDKDGNHYEQNEVSDTGLRSFPLLSQDEIKERAAEARELFSESTGNCD